MSLSLSSSYTSPPLWTPANINTALWLDAADASTITTVSGAVSEWRDKSGNGRNATQGTAANRPAYTTAGQNGLNVVTFDGSDDWLALPNTTNPSGANATFAACKPNHTAAGGFIIGRAYNWGSWQLASASTGTSGRYGMGRDGIDERVATVSSLTNNTNKIFSGTYDNTNVRLSVNGGSFASTAYTPNPTYNANDATTLGAARNTSNLIASPFPGGMYEVIVLHFAPSQDLVDRVQGYLAHKWGLTANLPAGHPYKLLPPYMYIDPDAQSYISAVEAADGQALETGVRDAINAFVIGCKSDGIWSAIKASCILAGARTLSGALVPLVGAAPSNNNFVNGDYNRKTGLIGNGNSKWLNTNRNNNADPQNSKHGAVYISTVATSGDVNAPNAFPSCIGTGASATGAFTYGRFNSNSANLYSRANNATAVTITGAASSTGFVGQSRSASASYTFRYGGSNQTVTQSSETPFDGTIGVFREGAGGATNTTYSNARLAFYSIGESLTLSLLDSRVSTLINAIAAAIP